MDICFVSLYSLHRFIKTGIRYYIGFGEERGACAVFPNKTLGPQRKLGINELLLHHHMVRFAIRFVANACSSTTQSVSIETNEKPA